MKQRSEQGGKDNLPAEIKQEVLPALSVSNELRAFKQQVNGLNEVKMVNEIMKTERSYPSLIKRSREDHALLIDEICLLIIDLQKFYNTKEKLSEDQILDLAEIIVGEYTNLTMLDLAFCFKQGKIGAYGKVYERIDGGVLLGWIREWDQKRMNMIIDRRESEHIQQKAAWGGAARSSDGTLKQWIQKGKL